MNVTSNRSYSLQNLSLAMPTFENNKVHYDPSISFLERQRRIDSHTDAPVTNNLCINTGIISLELPIFIHGGAHFGPLQLYQSLSALVWSVLTLALSLLKNAPSWLHAAPISKQPAGLWLQYLM